MPSVKDSSFSLDAFTMVNKEAIFVGSNVGPNWCINQMLSLCAEKDIQLLKNFHLKISLKLLIS